MSAHYEETTYGFKWGAAEVTRCISDPKAGVVLTVTTTTNQVVNIRVTPSGQIRVGEVGRRVHGPNGSYEDRGAAIP